jgi:hypothetical protein
MTRQFVSRYRQPVCTGWVQKRTEAFALGVCLREQLVSEYITQNALAERPLLKDIIEDLITEVQGARLRRGVLPLHTFAQTERVGTRLEVTLNSRLAAMERVSEPALLEHVALWHEAVHIAVDFATVPEHIPGTEQLTLPSLEAASPRLVMCRRGLPPGVRESDANWMREFRAEHAALAAAIAGPDLQRCMAFQALCVRAEQGGELGGQGWRLLYETGAFIGVNISALVRYLSLRGLIAVERRGMRHHLYGLRRLVGRLEWA